NSSTGTFHLTFQWTVRYIIGMSNRAQSKSDLLQGTLDLMVLQTLDTLGPLHGYAIAARLEQVSSGAVRLNMGTLYACLMRLEIDPERPIFKISAPETKDFRRRKWPKTGFPDWSLEQRGFVRGQWNVTENNRKARFYSITAVGRRQL